MTAITRPDSNLSSAWLLAKMTFYERSTARPPIMAGHDLVDTLHAIVIYERERSTVVQINVAETNTRINPKDHSDHLMTAKAALEAVKDLSCVRRVYYVDYASSRLPQNLDAQQRDMESSVFAVTLAGVQALDHGTSWRYYDQSFVGRTISVYRSRLANVIRP